MDGEDAIEGESDDDDDGAEDEESKDVDERHDSEDDNKKWEGWRSGSRNQSTCSWNSIKNQTAIRQAWGGNQAAKKSNKSIEKSNIFHMLHIWATQIRKNQYLHDES